jgi:DNA-binding PadR family transcriptional regulator
MMIASRGRSPLAGAAGAAGLAGTAVAAIAGRGGSGEAAGGATTARGATRAGGANSQIAAAAAQQISPVRKSTTAARTSAYAFANRGRGAARHLRPAGNRSKIINITVKTESPADELLRGPIKSKTIFPALVLHLLTRGPEHGYGLLQRIDAICSDLIAVNTNTIYPLLRRLEERGFIAGEWDHPIKRSRRLYRITPAGRERLERIKTNMLPYLDLLAGSIDRLRGELYERVNHDELSRSSA